MAPHTIAPATGSDCSDLSVIPEEELSCVSCGSTASEPEGSGTLARGTFSTGGVHWGSPPAPSGPSACERDDSVPGGDPGQTAAKLFDFKKKLVVVWKRLEKAEQQIVLERHRRRTSGGETEAEPGGTEPEEPPRCVPVKITVETRDAPDPASEAGPVAPVEGASASATWVGDEGIEVADLELAAMCSRNERTSTAENRSIASTGRRSTRGGGGESEEIAFVGDFGIELFDVLGDPEASSAHDNAAIDALEEAMVAKKAENVTVALGPDVQERAERAKTESAENERNISSGVCCPSKSVAKTTVRKDEMAIAPNAGRPLKGDELAEGNPVETKRAVTPAVVRPLQEPEGYVASGCSQRLRDSTPRDAVEIAAAEGGRSAGVWKDVVNAPPLKGAPLGRIAERKDVLESLLDHLGVDKMCGLEDPEGFDAAVLRNEKQEGGRAPAFVLPIPSSCPSQMALDNQTRLGVRTKDSVLMTPTPLVVDCRFQKVHGANGVLENNAVLWRKERRRLLVDNGFPLFSHLDPFENEFVDDGNDALKVFERIASICDPAGFDADEHADKT